VYQIKLPQNMDQHLPKLHRFGKKLEICWVYEKLSASQEKISRSCLIIYIVFFGYVKENLCQQQAMETHRVVRRRSSHIF
jgi:hypothetical protein